MRFPASTASRSTSARSRRPRSNGSELEPVPRELHGVEHDLRADRSGHATLVAVRHELDERLAEARDHDLLACGSTFDQPGEVRPRFVGVVLSKSDLVDQSDQTKSLTKGLHHSSMPTNLSHVCLGT